MIDLPSLSEALAAWVAGAIARVWCRGEGEELEEVEDEEFCE